MELVPTPNRNPNWQGAADDPLSRPTISPPGVANKAKEGKTLGQIRVPPRENIILLFQSQVKNRRRQCIDSPMNPPLFLDDNSSI